MELTEKLLMDAGGWQAMKEAKALVGMGRVEGAKWTPPLLRGLVREGSIQYQSGLQFRSKSDIENLCGCRQSREWGTICAHSLAVGLKILDRNQFQQVAKEQHSDKSSITQPGVASSELGKNYLPDIQPVMTGQHPDLVFHLVIAPPLEKGWESNAIRVVLEVTCHGKRSLASAIDQSRRYKVRNVDVSFAKYMIEQTKGGLPGMTCYTRIQFVSFLYKLPFDIDIRHGKETLKIIANELFTPIFTIKKSNNDLVLSHVVFNDKTSFVFADNGLCFQFIQNKIFRGPDFPAPYSVLFEKPVTITSDHLPNFLKQEWPVLSKIFRWEGDLALLQIPAPETEKSPPFISKVSAGIPETILELEGSLNQLVATLQWRYGKRMVTAGASDPADRFEYSNPENPLEILRRNPEFERDDLSTLKTSGFDAPDSRGRSHLRGEREILRFFAQDYPSLQRVWKVTLGERFETITSRFDRIGVEIDIQSSGIDWFEMEVHGACTDGSTYSLPEIQRLLQSGLGHTRSRQGKTAVFDPGALDDLSDFLVDANPTQVRPGVYRMSKAQGGYLLGLAEASPGIVIRGAEPVEKWAPKSLENAMKELDFGSASDLLRPYQKLGVAWFQFLSKNGFGGILADEMGLGKTLQTLMWLRMSAGERSGQPSLVVCPTSVVENWRREAQKWTPELKTLAISGADRKEALRSLKDQDLVITSYALLKRDEAAYRGIHFFAVILDEAQHIKNPDSQNAKAATGVKSAHRFVLTGTPVENSVRDLWSLFQFLMPGYLGQRNDFKDRYESPMRNGEEGVAARLRRRIGPFVMRRTKREVASDLPEKLQQTILCELTDRQKAVYAGLLDATRKTMGEAVEPAAAGKLRMKMLTAILRLRQTCCDLRLLEAEAEPSELEASAASAKLMQLEELLQEAADGGHRVLVFSQFARLLRLVSTHLSGLGLEHCYLDGSTRDRQAEVDRFQSRPEITAFLISLKAGGTGLNLTAADTVVLLDPWWNPAVEAQAIDRAHRIGQDRVVTVYRLIAAGTIEEKIVQLQAKKRETAEALVETEEPIMQGLDLDDLRALLD